ncbi:hypothetical protein HMPREF1022_03296 [Desulfovibrio sp. 6_1_46AFAA]|uniref:hypothetical protein n=1 Tax=Desulfovibrio sp. 6_1_46AFAA TaxID=665942 RepID=UPI00022373BA|nr:hypothetical protein [Desulfovibrio sp. 6_1_46AFAA]EGW49667.1 hypothetical protein HMPREF1022_03296 [Desulfovibrio sp. 6_1_46AFAA]
MSSTGHDPTSSRAPEQELAALHGALAKHMADMLKSKEPVPPATLNAIRQFLKDNGIDCHGIENPDINDITKALPTFEGDGEDVEERLLH